MKKAKKMPVECTSVGAQQKTAVIEERSLDLINSPGCYSAKIKHTSSDVRLPLEFCSNEHYITATLIVTESGTDDELQRNRLIGQTLIMPDCNDGLTRIFTRAQKKINEDYVWSDWCIIAQSGIDDKITNTGDIISKVTRLMSETKEIKTDLSSETARTKEAEAAITKDAILSGSLNVNQDTDRVTLAYRNIDATEVSEVDIPAATTEKAGVMSAEDKINVAKSTVSLQYGRNLFIKDDAVLKGYIGSNGTLNPYHTDWFTTENFVNVKPNTDYKRTSVVTVAFYDINKNFVKHVEFSAGETFTSPSNAFFAKFSVQSKSTAMVSEADKWEDVYVVGEYPEIVSTSYGLPLKRLELVQETGDNTDAVMSQKAVTDKFAVSNLVSLQYGRNLFIKDDAVLIGYITPSGYLNPNYADWFTTENFVNVKPNTDYKRTSAVTVAFYDINKNFVKQLEFSAGETFTSPSNAFFAKFSLQSKSTAMVSEAEKWNDTYVAGEYPEIETTAETKFSLPGLLGGETADYKIATLGDSVTQRGQWQDIIEKTDGVTFLNNGLSGRTVQYFAFHHVDGTTSDYDRILTASDFTGVDAIVICGYANSLWDNMGSMDAEYITINAEDADADLDNYPIRIGQYGYISALRSVIEYIMSICPAIPIVISSQLPMSRPLEGWNGATTGVDFGRVYNGSNKTCKDFADATKEVAEYYHLHFVDLHSNGQVNIHNYTTYYDGDDTTHPNFRSYNSQTKKFPVSGMRMMARLIGDAIKKVI